MDSKTLKGIDERLSELEADALRIRQLIVKSNSRAEIRQLRKINDLLGWSIAALRWRD